MLESRKEEPDANLPVYNSELFGTVEVTNNADERDRSPAVQKCI